MPAIEALLTVEQKRNLEEARHTLGLRSRAELFRVFANHAVELVAHIAEVMPPPAHEGPLTGLAKVRE